MIEWYSGLSALEQVYFWIAVIATILLIVQIVMLCFSAFGGDVDIDGDGDIDVDTDSGFSIFTLKSITAFFAVGGWAGLLTCALTSDNLQWLSIFVALIAGVAAGALVVVLMHAMNKMQSNGILDTDNLIGKRATVYLSIPAKRDGRGKISLTAQGKYMELDAVTDESEKIRVDEAVEIISVEGECMVVRKAVTENNGAKNDSTNNGADNGADKGDGTSAA